MNKIFIILILIFFIIGCNKNYQHKKALVNTIIYFKNGTTQKTGWEEVIILKENNDMVKVKWIVSGQTGWVEKDNTNNFRILD